MRVRVFALALSTALVPGSLAAQACLGMPSSDGQIGIAATGTSIDGELEVGGEFHVDVTGPASFRIEYNNGHDDGIGRTYGAMGAYELYLLDPSICGVAGAFHTSNAEPGHDQLGLNAGFGIGKTLQAERFTATIYAIPRYVYLIESRVVAGGGEADESSSEFMAEAGVTFGIAPLFVGGGLTLSTIGDGDPGFRIRVGILF